MIHAYDRVLLPRASEMLGRMLDFSVHSLHMNASQIMALFIASGKASLFERGDARTILGCSGIELAYDVLERSGVPHERIAPRHTISLSPEYWCGYALAHLQHELEISFDELLNQISERELISEFASRRTSLLQSLPWDTGESEKNSALLELGYSFVSDALEKATSRAAGGGTPHETQIKKIRKQNGLSQSQLAKASGVPLRTIQQYEQGQKDINRARAEYLIMLAASLNCEPHMLLERN